MVIYLICYIVVGLLLINIDRYGNKINKFTLFVSIAILTLLAAFRKETIGVDVRGYALSMFVNAKTASGFNGFIYYMEHASIEWGYKLLVYICTKIFRTLSGVLFGTALLINCGVVIGLYRVRKHIPVSLASLAYCFLFYQETYNMMRQWIAIAIIVFGITYIYEKNLVKYGITVLVAALFHTSAIIAILLYFVVEIVRRRNSVKWQLLTIFGTLFCVININFIMQYFVNLGWLNERYMYFVTGNALTFSFPMFIVRVPPIAVSAVLYKEMRKRDELHKGWFLFLIIDLIISQLHSVMDFAQRIGSYFTISQMYELSLAANVGKLKQRIFVKVLVIMFLIMYWYVYYIYLNFGNTYPYVAMF